MALPGRWATTRAPHDHEGADAQPQQDLGAGSLLNGPGGDREAAPNGQADGKTAGIDQAPRPSACPRRCLASPEVAVPALKTRAPAAPSQERHQ
jgi:hypothetical protein